MSMNFSKASRQSNTLHTHNPSHDSTKLIEICKTYGLDQKQTDQLIEEFKRGALVSHDNSLDDSLNQSLTFSQPNPDEEYQSKQHDTHKDEEYSFKHPPQQMMSACFPSNNPQTQRQEHTFQSYHEEEALSAAPFDRLERLLVEKMAVDKGLVEGLQEENSRLRKQLAEKDQTIEKMIDLKREDSEVVRGLKDIITTLSETLRQKESAHRDLQDKYVALVESTSGELTRTPSQGSQLRDTTNMPIPSTNASNKMRQESRESLEGSLKEGRKAGPRIDVKKYKEMMEKLRSNY